MDLRPLNLSPAQVARGAQVLNYQPFFLSPDVQTGAAYSWVNGGDPRVEPPLVFARPDWEPQWDQITEANGRLSAIYDDLIGEVARRYPGGSFLDVACNNGYFPVTASLKGMKACGYDIDGQHADAVRFLNEVTGASADFVWRQYQSNGPIEPEFQFDVVSASAIMCHLPNPLHFLAYLGAHAKEALLFWGQVIDTDALCVSYQAPHSHLPDRVFPHAFNDNTRISMGLFQESIRLMGFKELIEIEPKDYWLWGGPQPVFDLYEELKGGSRHRALLAVR